MHMRLPVRNINQTSLNSFPKDCSRVRESYTDIQSCTHTNLCMCVCVAYERRSLLLARLDIFEDGRTSSTYGDTHLYCLYDGRSEKISLRSGRWTMCTVEYASSKRRETRRRPFTSLPTKTAISCSRIRNAQLRRTFTSFSILLLREYK